MRHKRLTLTAVIYVITYELSFAVAAQPMRVVASLSILGDLASRVGGDRIELRTLVGPALSPADGPASTYIDMMRANSRTLASALAAR